MGRYALTKRRISMVLGMAVIGCVWSSVPKAYAAPVVNQQPTVVIQAPTDTLLNQSQVTIIATGQDDVSLASLEVVVHTSSSAVAATCSVALPAAPVVMTQSLTCDTGVLTDGTYTITAAAVDYDGVTSTATPQTFIIDTTHPELEIINGKELAESMMIGPTLSIWSSDSNNITGVEAMVSSSPSDPGTAVDCQSQQFQATSVSTTCDLSFLPSGTYTITISATDVAGNTTVTELPIVIDNSGPTVSIVPINGNDQTPEITGYVDDPTAILFVVINDVVYPASVSNMPLSNGLFTWKAQVTQQLNYGTYDITVLAVDPTGNSSTDETANELSISPATAIIPVSIPSATKPNSRSTIRAYQAKPRIIRASACSTPGHVIDSSTPQVRSAQAAHSSHGTLHTSAAQTRDGWWDWRWIPFIVLVASGFWWLIAKKRRKKSEEAPVS